jgi:hypothetical protein
MTNKPIKLFLVRHGEAVIVINGVRVKTKRFKPTL